MKNLILIASICFSFNLLASDYDKILTQLQSLDNLPNTTLFTLGQNDQGQDIMGIIVGDPSYAKVKHMVVGTHHGNERAAAVVPVHFAEMVATRSDLDTLYYIIPVLNISGYNSYRREETGPDGRRHDSNRDYEDPCLPKQDFKLKSTTLLAEFVEREDIVSAVTVHGYVGTFTYPWGTSARDYSTQDDAFLSIWAKKSAQVNSYKTGTHGAAIYPANGAFEDWAYYKLGVWSFLLEIRSPSSDLKKDAASLVEFFVNSPMERSKKIGQPVNCIARLLDSMDNSRP